MPREGNVHRRDGSQPDRLLTRRSASASTQEGAHAARFDHPNDDEEPEQRDDAADRNGQHVPEPFSNAPDSDHGSHVTNARSSMFVDGIRMRTASPVWSEQRFPQFPIVRNAARSPPDPQTFIGDKHRGDPAHAVPVGEIEPVPRVDRNDPHVTDLLGEGVESDTQRSTRTAACARELDDRDRLARSP